MGRGAGGGGGRVPINISEEMAGRFAGAPREHIALVQGVEVRPERAFEITSRRMGRQAVLGSANMDTGKITLGKGATGATSRHELGHVVYSSGLTGGQRNRVNFEFTHAQVSIWGGHPRSPGDVQLLGARQWVSGYGFSNELESFAEGYMMWTNPRSSRGRERVSRVAPEMAAVLAETTGIGI